MGERSAIGTPIRERLERWSVPEPNSGCTLWLGARTPLGYGRITLSLRASAIPNWNPGPQYAHRVAYATAIGAIPDGLTIDHLCRNRSCINPSHMEPDGTCLVSGELPPHTGAIAPAASGDRLMTAHDDGDLCWLGALIGLASAALMVALMAAVWRLLS